MIGKCRILLVQFESGATTNSSMIRFWSSCTWYYYYQQINENEVKQNARWLADNLKDYGAQYVQIDDGWQGTGRVYTRDWTNVSDKFPSGMDKLASYIKPVGLTPGSGLRRTVRVTTLRVQVAVKVRVRKPGFLRIG